MRIGWWFDYRPKSMGTVRATGLVKTFGTVTAVNDLSFEARAGEFLTLLGPSGCGKTTTLRLVAGLERPDRGEISVGDRPVSSASAGLFVPPERYHGQLELPAPIEENESLLFGVKRLVAELAGFLHGRGTGVTRLRCDLVHEDVAPTSIVVGLTATRQIEHMMNVLRERLARETLPDRVEAIRIVSEEFALLGAKEGDFFPVARKDGEAEAQLIERLRARLGEDAVHKLELCADHRPELSSGQTELIADAKARYFEGSKESAAPRRAADLSPPEMTLPIRPLWLLASPRPLGVDPAAAEIKLTSGPERIETGWWDGKDVGRDYFVARNARGEALWLYRERGGEWFVHGVFA